MDEGSCNQGKTDGARLVCEAFTTTTSTPQPLCHYFLSFLKLAIRSVQDLIRIGRSLPSVGFSLPGKAPRCNLNFVSGLQFYESAGNVISYFDISLFYSIKYTVNLTYSIIPVNQPLPQIYSH